MNDELKNFINKTIDQKLSSMTNMEAGQHAHNGFDVNQLDPAIALLGFPVIQVTDASIAPTDSPQNGTFRFQVDTTPDYYLWAWLVYQDASGVLNGAWVSVALT